MNIAKREREIKPKKRQVMYNAIAHHLLIDAQPVPEQQSAPLASSPQFIY